MLLLFKLCIEIENCTLRIKMSNSSKLSRFQRAKSEMSDDRSSVGIIRNNFRSKFFSRLRSTRSKSVDRFRQIVENYGDNLQYKSVQDLRKALLQDKEAATLLTTDEVTEVLNQIEREIAQIDLQQEGEEYVKQNEMELEDIVNRHLNMCQICNKFSEHGSICTNCSSVLCFELN